MNANGSEMFPLDANAMVSQLEAPLIDTHRPLSHRVEGLVQVFTCHHRSFFTSVMAQALRIAGQGTPALVVQFLKGGIGQGHKHPVRLGQHLDWLRCDLPRCIDTPEVEASEQEALQVLWQHTQQIVMAGQYELVVLDELSMAINFGLIDPHEVLELLRNRPRHIDVILTGPEMPDAILEIADQVTELRRTHRP